MRRYSSCLIALTMSGLACTLLTAHEQQTGADVLKQLQGTWRFTQHEMDGKGASKDELAKMKITFADNKWTIREDGKVIQEGTHKFDPTKMPGQVDAAVTEGESKGNTMLGIYGITGDTMKVCFDPAGKVRPTSFAPKAGQLHATVQRDKK